MTGGQRALGEDDRDCSRATNDTVGFGWIAANWCSVL
jgi:hypothetical protein